MRRPDPRCKSWQGDHFRVRRQQTVGRASNAEQCWCDSNRTCHLCPHLVGFGLWVGRTLRVSRGAARTPRPINYWRTPLKCWRYLSAWPSSSGLRLLNGPTQVQILPRGPLGGETGRGAGTRLKRAGRLRAAGEHDLSPPPFFGEQSRGARRPVGSRFGPPGLWGRTTALRHFSVTNPEGPPRPALWL